MKLSTMHILVGIGTALTAVSVGVATKMACDKVNEVRDVRRATEEDFVDLTTKEKAKIVLPYYIAPVGALAGTLFGLKYCYTGSQEAIKIATDGIVASNALINSYRDLTKEAVGKKKEDEIYQKAIEKKLPKSTNLILGENDCLCMVVSPGIDDVCSGIRFVSNATKIKEATLDFNNFFIRRVNKSMLNNAQASIAEWFDFLGVKMDNKIADHLGWDYQKDGVVEIAFRAGLTEDNKPILGIEFLIDPHYIS